MSNILPFPSGRSRGRDDSRSREVPLTIRVERLGEDSYGFELDEVKLLHHFPLVARLQRLDRDTENYTVLYIGAYGFGFEIGERLPALAIYEIGKVVGETLSRHDSVVQLHPGLQPDQPYVTLLGLREALDVRGTRLVYPPA